MVILQRPLFFLRLRLERDLGMARTAPQLIENEIARDLEQPGGELRPWLVALRVFPNPHENLLRDVLRIGTASEHATDRADDQALVTFLKLFEGTVVPGTDQFHKSNIFSVFWTADGWADFVTGHVRKKGRRLDGQGWKL